MTCHCLFTVFGINRTTEKEKIGITEIFCYHLITITKTLPPSLSNNGLRRGDRVTMPTKSRHVSTQTKATIYIDFSDLTRTQANMHDNDNASPYTNVCVSNRRIIGNVAQALKRSFQNWATWLSLINATLKDNFPPSHSWTFRSRNSSATWPMELL